MAKTVQKKPTPKTAAKSPPAKAAASPKNLPAKVASGDVAEYDEDMLREMQGDSGRGVSTAAEDNIVPLIYVLQSLSPQVLKQKAEHIEGAEAGMFWMRGTTEVISGDEGIPVVLCHMSKSWIEWRPDRGGFVTRHGAQRPADATFVPDPKNPRRGQWELPNGNYVAETREHVVIRADTGDAYVLPMSGSNHGAARDWMSKCNRKRVPGSETKSPLWGYLWRVKTIARSNDQGDWFGILVEEETDDEGKHLTSWSLDGGKTYRDARQLNNDFETGVKQSDQADDDQIDSASEQEEDETV